MNTQQSSENPRRAATTATIRAYLVPVLVILLVITGGFSIYALNTGYAPMLNPMRSRPAPRN